MSDKPRVLTRRSFLTWIALGATAAAGGFVYVKRSVIRLVSDKLQHNLSPYRLEPAADAAGPLAGEEMANILSLARVLIPWAAGAEAVEVVTREYVDGRCRFEPGARAAYREASRLLDARAEDQTGGARFSNLDAARQEQIVAGIIPRPIRSRRDWRHVVNILFRYEETRATELVINDVLMNFYDDDRSWGYLQER
jgi:hypothetical protein